MRYRFKLIAVPLVSAALSGMAATPATAAPATQSGTLYLTAGSCAHGSLAGSYFKMILPSGSAAGPYMANSDSGCSNQEYTALQAGSEGGLRFGSYQPMPSPAFDAAGNAQAHSLTAPAQYEGTAFATSTNPVDPQTKTKVPAPSLTISGSTVSADVRAFSVSWNKQYFNQGSPKPDGGRPGITSPATGTYDAKTGAMTLSWTSSIVGGPFDKFTGSWHLVGKFVPPSGTATGTKSGGKSGGAATVPSAEPSSSAAASSSASAAPGGGGNNPTSAPSSAVSAAPVSVASQAAVTSVVTKHTWHVSWWLIVLAIVIAIAGFGALGAIRRAERTDAGSSS